jgi:hypothetical protein
MEKTIVPKLPGIRISRPANHAFVEQVSFSRR